MSARCDFSQLLGWRDIQTNNGLHGAQSEFVRIPQANGSLYHLAADLSLEEGLLLGDIAATAAFGVAQAGLAGWEGISNGNGVFALQHLLQRTTSTGSAENPFLFRTLVELGNSQPLDNPVCVVIGCGPVGLLAIIMARLCLFLRGYTNPCVFAIDAIPDRVRAAEKCGARSILLTTSSVSSPAESPSDQLKGLTNAEIKELICSSSLSLGRSGRGSDYVIECVGHPSALQLAYDVAAPFATLSSVGVHTSPFPFSPADVYDKNLTYRSGRCPARSLMSSAELLLRIGRAGRDGVFKSIKLTDIITHRYSLEDGPTAYDIFDKKMDGCLKAVLYPAGSIS